MADLRLLEERRVGQNEIAFECRFAHVDFNGHGEVEAREHRLHPLAVRIRHHRIRRLHDEAAHRVGIIVEDRIWQPGVGDFR